MKNHINLIYDIKKIISEKFDNIEGFSKLIRSNRNKPYLTITISKSDQPVYKDMHSIIKCVLYQDNIKITIVFVVSKEKIEYILISKSVDSNQHIIKYDDLEIYNSKNIVELKLSIDSSLMFLTEEISSDVYSYYEKILNEI